MNAAERIYAASASDTGDVSRLAEVLARRIEDDIAFGNLPPGDALGSLRELSERYSVGRSVAREAVGLLERRGLGRLRPGPSGGFIFAKPQPETIGEELANYFRDVGITLRQLMDAREAVDLMAARLAAAARPRGAELERLTAVSTVDDPLGLTSLRIEIARLAREPALLLFTECLNSLTLDFARLGDRPADDHGRHKINARAMVRALARGDAKAAAAVAARSHKELAASLDDQHARLGPVSITRLSTTETLPAIIARQLAAEIAFDGGSDARLGSEWELCERFSVSRLTLRQAIRLLQDSGLVDSRRGRGKGLVVRDRRSAGIIRMVLAYFIATKMDPMTAGTILFQMNCFVPALAAGRADNDQRRQLEAALASVESCDPFDRYELLGLVQCVSRLAGSPIIDLFSRCVAAYEARFRPSLAERLPASAQVDYFRLVRRLLHQTPPGSHQGLESLKAESSEIMLGMSRNRPF
ncbi:MAG: GntR family transcriptional regulator [Alphaproteobacteria bacterium]